MVSAGAGQSSKTREFTLAFRASHSTISIKTYLENWQVQGSSVPVYVTM